jgi:DNA polymerase-3 subunit gamma/tau
MGSAAPAVEELGPAPEEQVIESPLATADSPRASKAEVSPDSLRGAVLSALANQQMLVSILETATWTLPGNSLIARVSASTTMIEMSFTAEARRIASAAASGIAGRPIKMQVEPGGTTTTNVPTRRPATNGTARSRAEQDPIVQHMKEKFGAEIRTVIDYREKE